MSEPISAFVAYRAAASKGGNTGRKSNNKKAGGGAAGGSKAGANKKTEEKNTSLQKDKPKSGAKNRAEAKSSGVAKENGAPAKNKVAPNREKDGSAKAKDATKKTTPKIETPQTKNVANKAANKTEPAKQKQKGERAVTNGKQVSNGIKGNDIDTLVEQLLGDSPSNAKKLTKAQQKKKQELEDYLVRQLKQYDEEAGEEEEDSEFGSEEDYSSGSEEFSEYTINSYTDDDDEESEEEETELSGEYPTESVGENVPVAKSTKNKAAVPKRTELSVESSTESAEENEPVATSTKNIAPVPKRKSNEGAVAKTGSEASVPKKSRQAEKPVDKRKSMPAAAAATEKIEKGAQKRRSIASTSSDSASTSKVTVDAKMVKMEPLSPPNNIVKMNSIQEGEKVFRWLLSPLAVKEFLAKYWEASACLVKRKGSNYYSHLISFEAIDQMLIKNHVEFTKNIDITSYKNGERETLNPVGRAMPPIVWDHYGRGCSIRLLNPQTFIPELFQLNTTLQEYFHCLVGANAYLTPPNSQGFAPHYDDIEAFVLQIEGRKRWRLYKPRTQAEQLPRFSSKNFKQQEIGKPIFDEVLEPGDMLYFPRGTIHQACTEPGYHSLHITLSVYQKQSYADLFERMVPLVLQRAIESNLDMRRGLPLHTFQHAGIAYSDNDTQERAELLRKVTELFGQCLDSAPLAEMMDAAVDQLAKKYQHEALPPHVLPTERARTIFGSRSTTNEQGECMCDYEIDERTNVRLLRANILRLVQEESKVRIYYYLDNSKEYCEYEPNFIEIESDEAASVEVLIRSYPEYVGVSQLPMDDEERKVQMVTALWERGLLMTEKPFK
ncbi:bifunctional lysine-specific demethylase and histidyl-hydroxylase NO66 [Rhagoletis pomonella]|uniref:bifunctional lysine-specific demethylase and histidyl-hydroxylase NO66 n=1 Tax=Rhagoletis pomonella TaxID=28610 RepID=UPI00177CC66D|nr:bifunctional lysine-specific demethylase and histidyl-hydroxylase NO66 [Rhagoletis pomonella]